MEVISLLCLTYAVEFLGLRHDGFLGMFFVTVRASVKSTQMHRRRSDLMDESRTLKPPEQRANGEEAHLMLSDTAAHGHSQCQRARKFVAGLLRIGGKGYSRIQRAPAYTFGHMTPVNFNKQILTAKAPVLDISGHSKKGPYRIPLGVVSPRLDPILCKGKSPGPDRYVPKSQVVFKRPPVYSMRPAAKPPYQPWDMWTPPPNMYLPRIHFNKPPAYTLGYAVRELTAQNLPGPGEHDPNFDFVKLRKPAFSFGAPFKSTPPKKTPPPNTYCEKKFMYPKRTIPAPTFGIRHSPYLGKQEEYLTPSNLCIVVSGED